MATVRQTKAIHNVVENHGNVSKAMREAGYSEISAKNPKNLTESKAWQEYMDEYLSDATLAKVHAEGLKATKRSGTGGMKIGIGTDGQVEDFGHTDIDEPDYAVRHKYLDSAYKLKGAYAAEKHLNVNIDLEPTEELIELAKEINDIKRNNTRDDIAGNGIISSTVGGEIQDKE